MSEEKNPVGRPRHFDCPVVLFETFKEYVEKCKKEKTPLTVSGFCVHIEAYKDLLNEYKKKQEFSGTIKTIYSIIENDIELGILQNMYNTTAGIFNLKNNFGQTDKQEVKQDIDMNLTINDLLDEDLKNDK